MQLIKQLAALAGLQHSYVHAQGHTEHVSLDKQQAILQAMGFDLSSDSRINQQITELTERPWFEVLAPVNVCQQGQPIHLRVQQLQQHAVSDWQWQICTEEQQQFNGTLQINAADIIARQAISKGDVLAAELALDISLPLGYHQLTLSSASTQYQQQLIVTPQRCFQLHDKAVLHKTFGPAIQLYAVKSARNWGIGDFTDLSNTVNYLAGVGADFIGLNPIHALYPAMPESASPYSPSSRRWLNVSYIDVAAMPGFSQCARTQSLVDGLKGAAAHAGVPFSADCQGGMFGFFLLPELAQNYSQVMKSDSPKFNKLFHGLLDGGVYIAPALYEAGFVSAAHTEADIAETVRVAGDVFKTL